MKKVTIMAFLFVLTGLAYAQGPPPPPPGMDEDKIEALRIAFLTKYLDLSTEEAQKFWPVYNNMQKELDVIRQKEKDLRQGKDVQKMSDDELNKMIAQHFDNEQKSLDIKMKYVEEFKKVLSLKKVALLTDAESEFKREMMKHARDKQGPPPGEKGEKGDKGPNPPPAGFED